MSLLLDREQPKQRTGPPPPVFHRSGNRKRLWIYLLGGILAAAAALAGWRIMARPAPPAWSAASVQRARIERTITATGKLQALTTVQVGTQVSGTISELYADFNDRVRKGQVIARLDPSQLQAQLTQARANQSSAIASVQTAQSMVLSADAAAEASAANVERLHSMQEEAERNLERTGQLVEQGIGARRDLETAQAALAQAAAQKQQALAQLNQAKAQAQSARSQLAQARAQATQAGAAVQVAAVNLERATITAPIDGVIVARNVDPGQTVAASFQSPTLFLIANDLTRMQVLADIDEADVGQLGRNSPVEFHVDAYPAETFHGRIAQIRLAPQTVQNVTTYTAVIDVDNPELKLKPGMTANVTVTVAERDNVLAVPNAALRFQPEGAEATRGREAGTTVWRIEGEKLEPVAVRLGITDGAVSEVTGGALREGDRVAVADQAVNARPEARGANPFAPGRPRGGRR